MLYHQHDAEAVVIIKKKCWFKFKMITFISSLFWHFSFARKFNFYSAVFIFAILFPFVCTLHNSSLSSGVLQHFTDMGKRKGQCSTQQQSTQTQLRYAKTNKTKATCVPRQTLITSGMKTLWSVFPLSCIITEQWGVILKYYDFRISLSGLASLDRDCRHL